MYDLLLDISWMKRVKFIFNYKTEQIIINEDDNIERTFSAKFFSMQADLFIIEFEKKEETSSDEADAICQLLLNEQENFQFWSNNQNFIRKWMILIHFF